MDILMKEDREEIIRMVKTGAVFIYPTDTVYGIGCDATNEKAVVRVREIKDRLEMPLSVIVPSKEWISDNCKVSDKRWFSKLPGAFTLILPLVNEKSVAPSVVMGKKTLGVRLPKHWIFEIVKELGVPVVTTSVNKSGERGMTSIEDLDSEIKEKVDFMIDEGVLGGSASTLVDVENKKIIKR